MKTRLTPIIESGLWLILTVSLALSACGGEEESTDDMNEAGETPAGETPAGETPAGEMPAGETPAGETPAGETPAGETPAGETPAGETPAGETPAGETPAGETPSDECTLSGLAPASEQASGDGRNVSYGAVSSAETPYNIIQVQSLSDWMGPTSPGTYSLDGINYADCGLCLLAYTGCTESGCEKTLYAEEGSVDISEIGLNTGDRFSARLNGVIFREVTINQETFQSTIVEGGETWCLDGYEFDQELTNPNAGGCDQEGVNCVGDSIPDYELMSCATGEMVSARSVMDEKEKGLWMVLTASWCSACREFIPQVREQEPMLDDLGVNVIYVMGEDSNYGEPDLMECQQYAAVYGEGALERFYVDFSEGASFRSTFTSMWPYTGPMGEFGLPWNAMVRSGAYDYEYVYADRAGVGDLNAGINALISEPTP